MFAYFHNNHKSNLATTTDCRSIREFI